MIYICHHIYNILCKCLKSGGYGLVGSNQMLFLYPHEELENYCYPMWGQTTNTRGHYVFY